MLCTDWYPRHWNHSEIMTHSCWNISFIVSQFSFRENWYVCNFLLYRYEKEARRQSWEEQMLPAGQRWHLVVLVLVPATPTPWEKSSSRQTTRFSLQSRLERWTPLLQQQAPFHATAITQHCYCQRGSQSLYKYTSLGDPHHSCPGIELLFQYR